MQRRNFLKMLPAAGVSSFVVNGFEMRPFANTQMAKTLQSCDGVADRVLILIQLKGGNDGINTIIPIEQYDEYAALRPVIKVPDAGPEKYITLDNTLPSADKVGLHPVMSSFKSLYDKGWLNVVQGVGYENLNQSHFKSTDILLSGGDGTLDGYNLKSGWAGRALQAMYPDVLGAPIPEMLFPLGIQVGDPNPSLGFHTETEHQNVINLYGQDPDGFYSLVQTIGGAPLVDVPDSEYGVEIDYIMGVERSVDQYSEYITQAFEAGSNAVTAYPQSGFGYQLKTIARLIKGGCKTKVYLCSIGGFDTHGSQIPPEGTILQGGHANRLKDLADSLKIFYDDLQGLGLAEQVLSCTFSEFGRCAKENGSAGTDHGTLAPMFIVGKTADGGVNGTNVNLSNLTNDNQLQGQQFDYRQVFTTILQDFLGASNYVLEQTMFDGFVKMPLIGAAYIVTPDCYLGAVGTWDAPKVSRNLLLSPNPAASHTEVLFKSGTAFEARLTVHSLGGQMLFGSKVKVQAGTNLFYLQLQQLPPATYFVRLEHALTGSAEVTKLVKI